MMRSDKRCESNSSLKPVFALGGSVSGYASMGSIESLSGDLHREKKVWSTEDIISTDMPAVPPTQTTNTFKSSFAKELLEENTSHFLQAKKGSKYQSDPTYTSDFAVKIGTDDVCQTKDSFYKANKEIVEISDIVPKEPIDEFSRVKLENEILKLKLKSFNQDDEKYKKLQMEIEQLTWQLGKMEQSRLVYENATNQLGSFLEMVSTQLTLTKPGIEPNVEERMSRRRIKKSDRDITLPRRKSTHSILTNTMRTKSRSRSQVEDPSSSSSISCASSSLNTSASEIGRFSTRSSLKTLERVKERRERKEETGDIDNSDASTKLKVNNKKEELIFDQSLVSCNSTDEESKPLKSKSRTRIALGRIASFMRKEKSQNLSIDNSPKASLKYSSEHFSEPSSMSIIGFRGIWSLRNY